MSSRKVQVPLKSSSAASQAHMLKMTDLPRKTSHTPNVPSVPALKSSVTNPQVGKAVRERTVSLFQELSKVMRETAIETSKQQKANRKSESTHLSYRKAEGPVKLSNLDRIAQEHTLVSSVPERKSTEVYSEKGSIKKSSTPKIILPKEGIVPTSIAPFVGPIIPSIMNTDVHRANPLVGHVAVMPSVSGQTSSQSNTNGKIDPIVIQSNSILCETKDSGTVLQAGNMAPTIVYSVTNAPMVSYEQTTQQDSLSVTSAEGSSQLLPPTSQVYTIVHSSQLPSVSGVQPTVYKKVLPAPTSTPLTLLQPSVPITSPSTVSSIQPAAVLNAEPGTVLFAYVGTPPPTSATSTSEEAKRATSPEQSVQKSTEEDSESIEKSSECPAEKVEASKPQKRASKHSRKSAHIEKKLLPSSPEGTSTAVTDRSHTTPDEEVSLLDETSIISPEENIREDPSKSATLKEAAHVEPLVEKTDFGDGKRVHKSFSPQNDFANSAKQQQDKENKTRSNAKAQNKNVTFSAETPSSPPRKLSQKEILENRLHRIKNLYSELPPKKTFVNFSMDECLQLKRYVSEVTCKIQNITEDVRAYVDAPASHHPAPGQDKEKEEDDGSAPGQILCRLCAGFFKRESLIPLYKGGGEESSLVTMINAVLPEFFQTRELDGLPQQICKKCANKAAGCYKVVEGFIQADTKLRNILMKHTKLRNEPSPPQEEQVPSPVEKSPSPIRKRLRQNSSAERSEEETRQQHKRKCESELSEDNSVSQGKPAVEGLDLSRLDPEYNDGFEVEWCLDEETIRSSLAPLSPSHKEHEDSVSQKEGHVSEALTDTSQVASQYTAVDEMGDEFETREEEVATAMDTEDTVNSHNYSGTTDNLNGENDSLNSACAAYRCSVCRMVFSSKREAILHQAVHQESSLPPEEKANRQRGRKRSAVHSKRHQVEVSGQAKNKQLSIECDQCELSFINEYSYFIHKCAVHDCIMDSQSLSKYKSDLEEKHKVNSGKKVVRKGNTRQKAVSQKVFPGHGGVYIKCGSGMLWVNSSRLETKQVGSSGELLMITPNGSPEHKVKEAAASNPVVGEKKLQFQCSSCNSIFNDKASLSEHMKEHGKRYMCNECNRVFLTLDTLNNHIPSHIPSDCVCDVCGVVVTNSKKLGQHKKEHTNRLPHNCETCGKSFPNDQTLKVHTAIHSGRSGPLTCLVCKKLFYFRRNLLQHRLSHSSERPHKCSVCFRIFKRRMLLNKHLALHRLTKCFVCCVCHQLFSSWNGLVRHKYQKHLGTDVVSAKNQLDTKEPSPFYQCNMCNQVLESKGNLLKHFQSHKATWPFYCFQCNRKFVSEAYLSQHMCYSRIPVRYQCNICGKTFSKNSTFRVHKTLHNFRRKHSCRYCGKSFKWYQSLFNHVLAHSNKQCQCPCCHKLCMNKSALWKHHSIKCRANETQSTTFAV